MLPAQRRPGPRQRWDPSPEARSPSVCEGCGRLRAAHQNQMVASRLVCGQFGASLKPPGPPRGARLPCPGPASSLQPAGLRPPLPTQHRPPSPPRPPPDRPPALLIHFFTTRLLGAGSAPGAQGLRVVHGFAPPQPSPGQGLASSWHLGNVCSGNALGWPLSCMPPADQQRKTPFPFTSRDT